MENIRKIVAAESRRFLRFQFLFFLVLFASTLLYRSISLFMENKKLGDGIIAYFAPLMLLLLLFALEAIFVPFIGSPSIYMLVLGGAQAFLS